MSTALSVLHTLRVLFVDDQAGNVEPLLAELRRVHFAPIWQQVSSEDDYRMALSRENVDLILVRSEGTGPDCFQALRLLQASQLAVPFIIVTSSTHEDAALRCVQQGADDYLFEDRLKRLGVLVARLIAERNRHSLERQQIEIQLREYAAQVAHLRREVGKLIHLEAALREREIPYHLMTGQAVEQQTAAEIQRLNEHLQQRTQELEATNRELEAFSHSVAHELRAPLRAIAGFARMLSNAEKDQMPPEQQHYLERIHHNTRRMQQLIDNLFTFSQFNRQPFTLQMIEPAALVRQLFQELQQDSQGREVEWVCAQLPPCLADVVLLKHVFRNLLENALKFTRTRAVARIEVGTQPAEPGHVYFVRDNGVGFDMRYADRLFGVFQRLHSADEYEGTGVGLAIVQRIIHRLGGSIRVESEVDVGTTFFFTLPEPPDVVPDGAED